MKHLLNRISGTVWMIILGIILFFAGCLYIISVGGKYEFRLAVPGDGPVTVGFDDYEKSDHLAILSVKRETGTVTVRLMSLRPGKEYLYYDAGNGNRHIIVFYAHRSGIITQDDYFGSCTGMTAVKIGICVYLALWFVLFILKLRKSMRQNLYRYRNILYFGLIVFFAAVLLVQILRIGKGGGIVDIPDSVVNTMSTCAIYSFPVLVIVAILVTASNIRLIRKEGRTWRNMLACFLGIFLGILSLLPLVISEFLQRTTLIDVHNWRGTGRFVGMFLESFGGIIAMYAECILIGTIAIGIRAARHIPAFDKDYILIHGSRLKKDGTLTRLLQGRADRAVSFARMQKEATGKDIFFVPSGGKGDDEVISEAEAIRNYLLQIGIPEDRILLENHSSNTEENMEYAAKLIREREGDDKAKVAFSTTNYHVFRAGLLGTAAGLAVEGIGSGTKRYFWINAFVREFIATIYAERKRHLLVVLSLTAISIALILMIYISNAVLS